MRTVYEDERVAERKPPAEDRKQPAGKEKEKKRVVKKYGDGADHDEL